MTTQHVRARCGERMAAHARRGHERKCDACEAIPRKESPYSVRPCIGCGRPFKPGTSTHRACSPKCGRKAEASLQSGNLAKDVAEMRVPMSKRARLAAVARAAGTELDQRRSSAWNSWVDCLGLPEAMKEAA